MGIKTVNQLGQNRGGSMNVVCYFWREGKCNRNPCRFLHTHSPNVYRRNSTVSITETNLRKNPKSQNSLVLTARDDQECSCSSSENSNSAPTDKSATLKSLKKACKDWMSGNCVEGDRCQFLHSWFLGDGFSMLAKLRGHDEVVSGIGIPEGSDKLYSGSSDGTVRVWDCHTGKCARVMNLGGKIGSLISEGPWVFIGMRNVVKAWNIGTAAEFSLFAPVGHVYAMIVALDMLFAGAQDGDILVWKGSTENPNPFHLARSLKGHNGAVVCLAIGDNRLYSGSMDRTIKVWNLDTLQCTHTLNGHADAVMSVVCWNEYLLSCSLDQTIRVWFPTEGGNLEVTYTHNMEHGALALSGINDAAAKPILLCSCSDNSVRLYELPSFNERGRIFSKQEVRKIQTGPGDLFFTGDGTGMLTVWKLSQSGVRGS